MSCTSEAFSPGVPTLITNHDANNHCSLVHSLSSIVSARLDAIRRDHEHGL